MAGQGESDISYSLMGFLMRASYWTGAAINYLVEGQGYGDTGRGARAARSDGLVCRVKRLTMVVHPGGSTVTKAHETHC